MSNFHTLEVVSRGSEKQLQVGEKYMQILIVKVFNKYNYNIQVKIKDYVKPPQLTDFNYYFLRNMFI